LDFLLVTRASLFHLLLGAALTVGKPVPDQPAPGVSARAPALIRDVLLEKTTVCPGEDFKVTVLTSPPGPVEVLINGRMGNPQILRFPGRPGKRRIRVVASGSAEGIATVRREVQVVACPGRKFPLISARANPYREQTIDFTVRNAKELGLAKGAYVWDFGDASRATTDRPFVSHDYASSIDPAKPYVQLEATLTLPGQRAAARKSVTLRSTPYFNRRKGFVRPRVTTSRSFRKMGKSLSGDFRIRSLEEETIDFGEAREELQFCDPKRRAKFRSVPAASVLAGATGFEAGAPQSQGAGGAKRFLLAPKREIKGRVSLQEKDVPPEICGFAYHLLGKTKSGLRARASLYFEARPNLPLARKVTDEGTKRFLAELIRRKLVADPRVITDEDLYQLEQQGRIHRAVKGWEVEP
jgi:hypothetical protein